jgi:hypothetical protein
MNKASNTRLRLTTQVGQAHVGTRVPLDLGTNTQPFDSRTHRNTKPRVYRPTAVRPVHDGETEQLSLSGSTPVRPVLACETEQLSLSGSTPVKPVRHTGQTDHSLKAPKAPNRPSDHQTDPNSKQQHHWTTANTPRRSPEQNPTEGCTGQTGQEHRSDRCSLGSSG